MPTKGQYQCPKCDTTRIHTIKGWKTHMTRAHGGYKEHDLDKVLGTTLPADDTGQGKMAFLAEMEGLDTPPKDTQVEKPPTPPTGQEAQKTAELKTDAVARRMSGKLNKFKKNLAEKIPKVLNKAIKDKGPEWQLDTEDSELLAESVENCFEILDLEFRITPISLVLQNPLWVLLLPLTVLLLIFSGKTIQNRPKAPEEAKAAEEAPVDTKTESTEGVVFN